MSIQLRTIPVPPATYHDPIADSDWSSSSSESAEIPACDVPPTVPQDGLALDGALIIPGSDPGQHADDTSERILVEIATGSRKITLYVRESFCASRQSWTLRGLVSNCRVAVKDESGRIARILESILRFVGASLVLSYYTEITPAVAQLDFYHQLSRVTLPLLLGYLFGKGVVVSWIFSRIKTKLDTC